MVDRMEEAGLIERRADPADRRARLLFLTDRSSNEIARIQSALTGLIDSMLAGFSDAEERQLADMLGRVSANLTTPAKELAANG
jgi:DNA-binding MarR family transcriptional regulator